MFKRKRIKKNKIKRSEVKQILKKKMKFQIDEDKNTKGFYHVQREKGKKKQLTQIKKKPNKRIRSRYIKNIEESN